MRYSVENAHLEVEFARYRPRSRLKFRNGSVRAPAGMSWRANKMSVLLICVLIFVLFMVAGYAGLALQTRLVDEHKTGETKAVVGQISGLVSLLLALVLGTLIGVSWGYFSAQRTNLENFSAQILRLDQALGAIWARDQADARPAQSGNRESLWGDLGRREQSTPRC